MRHLIESEIRRFKGTGFFIDDELDSGLDRNILIRAVASEFDDVLLVIAFKIFPLWLGEEIGKSLLVSPVGIFIWMAVFDHLNIAIFRMLGIAQSVLNIFSDAVSNATGTTGTKKRGKCDEQAQYLHQNPSF